MKERRLSKRIPSTLEGRIVIDEQTPKPPRTLWDVSATGAHLTS
jgi:hypothetical protein